MEISQRFAPIDSEQAKEVGPQIKNEKHFKAILLRYPTKMRQSVFDIIKPHLSFHVRDMRMLMRHS